MNVISFPTPTFSFLNRLSDGFLGFVQFWLGRCAMSDTPTTCARNTINVVVRAVPNDGWFAGFYTGKRLCISEFPLRDAGRGFLARGYRPSTIITFQHGFPWPALTTLCQAAQNTETFEDRNIVRPVFGRAR